MATRKSKQYKTRRQARYEYLRDSGFLPLEAREFSKLNSAYPALRIMIRVRVSWLERFDRRAERMGWTSSAKQYEEKKRESLWNWYKRRGFITGKPGPKQPRGKGKHLPSPWVWYNGVTDKLPPEQQGDTPRRHKRKAQKTVTKGKITRSKQLANLRRMLKDAPAGKKPQIREWIRQLENGTQHD